MVGLPAALPIVQDTPFVKLKDRLVSFNIDRDRLLVYGSKHTTLMWDVFMAVKGDVRRTAVQLARPSLVRGTGVIRVVCLSAQPVL